MLFRSQGTEICKDFRQDRTMSFLVKRRIRSLQELYNEWEPSVRLFLDDTSTLPAWGPEIQHTSLAVRPISPTMSESEFDDMNSIDGDKGERAVDYAEAVGILGEADITGDPLSFINVPSANDMDNAYPFHQPSSHQSKAQPPMLTDIERPTKRRKVTFET